jgi:cytochrome c553
MTLAPLRRLSIGALLCLAATAWAAPQVVLIGGVDSEGPGRHEYRQGLAQLAAALNQSGLRVRQLPDWPADPHALDGAATLVLYCDGDTHHPLLDPARRRTFEALMQRGVGLVALHQASTLPADQTEPMQRWLGGVRAGLYDRTTETTTLEPAPHAVTRGITAFVQRDEFYPTLRFAARGVTPVLTAELHAQFRDGHAVVEDLAERRTVAWAYQRPAADGGGRAFGYTGAHFLTAFEQPMLRRLLVNAVQWTAGVDAGAAPPSEPALGPSAGDVPTFHHDALRTGWYGNEASLTPAKVAAPDFGRLWESPPLHSPGDPPARLYATPLFVERLRITAGPLRGQVFAAVIAATSNGDVYAVNAQKSGDVAPGRILWRTRLGPACRLQPAPLDGVPTGVLSTPVIDATRTRLYVTHYDPQQRWQAYALDLASGAVLPGWPVRLDEAALNRVNRNAGPEPVPPKRRFDFRVQRGALNLSPDGSRLYVVFGETETGWLASVDTQQARIASAFAAVAMPHRGSGGIWGAGGPAVDAAGRVYVVTGSGFDGYVDQPHDWTQSLLQLADDPAQGLRLTGGYTPFNHCATAKADIDLGSGGAALLPDAPGLPPLLVIGGKQGNAYLLAREALPGRLDRRPACGTNAASDGSLLPPEAQPQFGTRGPLNVFGPYSEDDGSLDLARARSVPASYRDAAGRLQVVMTGNSRQAAGSAVAVAPSLVRLAVAGDARAPHLRIEAKQPDLIFGNPGSPVVSSHGAEGAIVWVLDENAPRSAQLAGPGAPAPVLHAFDATTLAPLWESAPGMLHTSGKYNEPLIAAGLVIVGTDRIQAFGPGAAVVVAEAAPAVSATDPSGLWAQRCAACHAQPQGNIPPRARLAALQPARIVEALSRGVMRPQATGLRAEEIEALARWLTAPENRP